MKHSSRIVVEGEDLEMNLRFYMMVIPVVEWIIVELLNLLDGISDLMYF